jgi:uncharacterized protein YijF (DUF1287 family)
VSSRHHDRIRRLVAWMQRHAQHLAPRLAFQGSSSPELSDTSPEEIETARAEGRRILHVHFVSANAVENEDPGVTNREGVPVTDSSESELGGEPGAQFTVALPGGEIS